MIRYTINVWGTKDGYRFEVVRSDGSVAYRGWAVTEHAARRMAQRWIDQQPDPIAQKRGQA